MSYYFDEDPEGYDLIDIILLFVGAALVIGVVCDIVQIGRAHV